ncbi:TPA: KilA-N domain-containing protein [Salmonella enterica]|uniref:KilA-N domain-containing protein n=1 Tax=Salmonella enterica TaxID=28901 RepID=A0A750HT07_SALER|nr:KilA-N domain-containing protein [Salmonella enterica]HAF6262348.1 KilA-N domain-containing protein [Salmonella enterica]
MSTVNKLPVVVGVEIPLDESGRYNLNTIHKASGAGDDKSPGQWLRRKTTKELIKELDSNLLKNIQDVNLHLGQKSINSVHGGPNSGTFAHELLAVSYAGWIRASFQLEVNQAFIDYRKGKVSIDIANPRDCTDRDHPPAFQARTFLYNGAFASVRRRAC